MVAGQPPLSLGQRFVLRAPSYALEEGAFLDDLNVMGSPCMIDGRGVGCSTKTHLWILFTTVGDAVYTRCIQTPHYRT
jgi:hypothetical protein